MRSLDGITTTLSDTAVESLRAKLSGGLLAPGDAGYDDARAVWNGMIDRRPGLIAQCIGTADVVETVRFAAGARPTQLCEGWRTQHRGPSDLRGPIRDRAPRMQGVFVDTAGRTARGRRAARSARPKLHGLAAVMGFDSRCGRRHGGWRILIPHPQARVGPATTSARWRS